MRPEVRHVFHPPSHTYSYVVWDPGTRRAAIIDPVLDYDPASGCSDTATARQLVDIVEAEGLTVDWLLETHAHADHMMASAWLKDQLGAPAAIGAKVRDIAKLWEGFYNTPGVFDPDRDFDHLFEDGDTFKLGNLDVRVMLSPGHTLGSITYVVGDDAAFVHDTLMHVDVGTSRADFPGGDSGQLYDTLMAILALPDDTRLFVGHDYMPNGRAPRWESSVREQKASNPHLAGEMDEASYVNLRDGRDRTLPMPKLILHALQVNIRGGRLPEPDARERRILRIPLDALGGAEWDRKNAKAEA